MTSSESTSPFAQQTALVTGANSGLGFEAAAQLADAGYHRVVLACRTLDKAEAARQALVARVGSDPFETLEVDVSSIESSRAASDELVRRGVPPPRRRASRDRRIGVREQRSAGHDGHEAL